jgi:hypothetical protein
MDGSSCSLGASLVGASDKYTLTGVITCSPALEDETVTQMGAQNSVKKRVHLSPLIEGERARDLRSAHPFTYPSLTLAHPAREMRVLRRHGVGEREGELGVDFSSNVLCCQDFSVKPHAQSCIT